MGIQRGRPSVDAHGVTFAISGEINRVMSNLKREISVILRTRQEQNTNMKRVLTNTLRELEVLYSSINRRPIHLVVRLNVDSELGYHYYQVDSMIHGIMNESNGGMPTESIYETSDQYRSSMDSSRSR